MWHRGRLACSKRDEVGLNKFKKPVNDIPRIITCKFLGRARATANRFHEDRPPSTQERLCLSDEFIAILCISTARKGFSVSSLVTGKSRLSITLTGTLKQPRLRDDNPMLIDIHCMGPRPRHPVRQDSLARLQPRHFEKELRNGGVSGTSGPNNDGNIAKSGIADTHTGYRRCFTALKWEMCPVLRYRSTRPPRTVILEKLSVTGNLTEIRRVSLSPFVSNLPPSTKPR